MVNLSLVSIIIPVFNKGHQISDCLKSIFAQSYQNFEIIIVDDGSKDQSKSIVNHYCEISNKIRYYYQENCGVSSARNKGIALSTGEFLMFIDADDTIAPHYLENIFSSIKHEDDVVILGLTKIFENGIVEQVQVPKIGNFQKDEFLSDFAVQQQKNGIYGFVCNKILKSEILKKNNIKFNEELKLSEDLDFFIKYYSFCEKIKFLNETGYFYTQSTSDNLNTNNTVNYVQLIEIYGEMERMLEENSSLNSLNYNAIQGVKSDLKYAFFNEMKCISKDNVENGIKVLCEINLIQNKRISDTLLKWMLEYKLTYILMVYLKIRLGYMYLNRSK